MDRQKNLLALATKSKSKELQKTIKNDWRQTLQGHFFVLIYPSVGLVVKHRQGYIPTVAYKKVIMVNKQLLDSLTRINSMQLKQNISLLKPLHPKNH